MKDNEGEADFIEEILKKVEENGNGRRKKKRSGASQRKQQLNHSASPGREKAYSQTWGTSEGSASPNVVYSTGHLCSPYKMALEDVQTPKVRGLFSSLKLADESSHVMKSCHQRSRASNASFGSLPLLPMKGISDASTEFKRGNSESCQSTVLLSKYPPASPEARFLKFQKVEDARTCFMRHWSIQTVDRALERGDAFKAAFRVNVHNRLEAYCTIDGVSVDVLINGAVAQNRAIEGDIVAITIDPVTLWPRLKGSPTCLNDSSAKDGSHVVESVDECSEEKHDIDAVEKFSIDTSSTLHRDTISTYPVPGVARQVSTECHVHESTGVSVDVDQMDQANEATGAVQKLATTVKNFPFKRPSGNVVAIINKSPRRDAIVGSLGVKQLMSYREGNMKETISGMSKKNNSKAAFLRREYIQLTPMDGRLPKMMVPLKSLPSCIKERLHKADVTVETELVAAQINDWKEDCFLPQGQVICILGQSEDIEAQIAAILFVHAIHHVDFSQESLSCLPEVPSETPSAELEKRKDIRNLCVFTIDPSTATDLDDALSVERLSEDIIKVGVHIADVTYFVMPGTNLDQEAQIRSTSVYLLQRKIPMLPPVLSEDLGSLNPGVDKLAFSIFWEINRDGEILDQWIGHTLIRSCCKLSYQHAQDIIDGKLTGDDSLGKSGLPELHGMFEWRDVIDSVCMLNEISKTLKKNRFEGGALWLDNPKLVLLFDEWGLPYDSKLCERTDSNFLVEELMLLANMTAAKVISKAFPDCALLRRHPEPNMRKLKEFEKFCARHGFTLDISSSGQLHQSLQKMRDDLNNDPVLFDILVNYATKPMQLAAYFSTGQLKDRENEWMHYSLSVPFYTHFTSPLRRYPDIIVHRILNAVLEAEQAYNDLRKKFVKLEKERPSSFNGQMPINCFTGLHFDQEAAHSEHGSQVLREAASRHRVPGTVELERVASYCNERKLARRHVQEAGEKVYLWALLKRKMAVISDARVLALGPKFMSVYVSKFAMERRIYYDDVEGLTVHWLENTSALVLDFCKPKRSHRKGSPGKSKTLEDIAIVIDLCNPTNAVDLLDEISDDTNMEKVESTNLSEGIETDSESLRLICTEPDPSVFPLTLRLLSSVPVSVHAIGGDIGPPDIGVKLYLSTYFV